MSVVLWYSLFFLLPLFYQKEKGGGRSRLFGVWLFLIQFGALGGREKSFIWGLVVPHPVWCSFFLVFSPWSSTPPSPSPSPLFLPRNTLFPLSVVFFFSSSSFFIIYFQLFYFILFFFHFFFFFFFFFILLLFSDYYYYFFLPSFFLPAFLIFYLVVWCCG